MDWLGKKFTGKPHRIMAKSMVSRCSDFPFQSIESRSDDSHCLKSGTSNIQWCTSNIQWFFFMFSTLHFSWVNWYTQPLDTPETHRKIIKTHVYVINIISIHFPLFFKSFSLPMIHILLQPGADDPGADGENHQRVGPHRKLSGSR